MENDMSIRHIIVAAALAAISLAIAALPVIASMYDGRPPAGISTALGPADGNQK